MVSTPCIPDPRMALSKRVEAAGSAWGYTDSMEQAVIEDETILIVKNIIRLKK